MRLPLAALAVCFCTSANAQQPAQCAPRDVQVQQLTERYGESPVAMGLSAVGVVEYWANPSTGTWTVTITRPDGILCGIIAGLDFVPMDAPAPGVDG
jgi:hypothetical protein